MAGSKEYVVAHHAVNIWDPEASDDLKHAKRERIVRRLKKDEVVTEADLKFADVKRLLALGSIREKSEEGTADDPQDVYDTLSNNELKAEVKRRNEGRGEDALIAPESGSNDDLRTALRADDEDDSAVPEGAGAQTSQAH